MKGSPLKLLHTQFAGLSLVALDVDPELIDVNANPYPEVPAEAIEIKTELGLPDTDDDPHQFMVKIGASSTKTLPQGFPYRFAAQIEGIFHIEHDGDIGERKRMVVINGGSMLFGIIREQILTLSHRHKNGPLLLPSLDFRGLGLSDDEEEDRTESVAKRPRRAAKRPKSPR